MNNLTAKAENTAKPRRRNVTLDVAKAICIMLMVVGHSGAPRAVHDFIYMFHMPCFFLVSGYLLNEKYLTDIALGAKRKIKGLYKPFVKWTLIFIALHNVFYALHFYTDCYSTVDFLKHILLTFLTQEKELFLGGYWFLPALLFASVFSICILSLLKRCNRLTNVYIVGG